MRWFVWVAKGEGLMRGFGCSGAKHSKYCPIWLKIEIQCVQS